MELDHAADVRKDAEMLFAAGYYCAESVVLALARAQGIDTAYLPRLATAFCSGMSRTCGTCGAVTGAIMGISLACGRSDPAESVLPSYTATQQLIREFEQEFGARECHVLLGCDLGTPQGQATFRTQALGERCRKFSGRAAEIAARLIAEVQG